MSKNAIRMKNACQELEGYPLSDGSPTYHPTTCLGEVKALLQDHGLLSGDVALKVRRLETFLSSAVRHHNAVMQFRMLFEPRADRGASIEAKEPETTLASERWVLSRGENNYD